MFLAGTLDYDTMLKVTLNVAEGLAHIHSYRILHGDVKSMNMMISNGIVKICDFGEASYFPVPDGSRGTSIYMAPELIRNAWASQYFSLKCDVWSFGIMIMGKIIK